MTTPTYTHKRGATLSLAGTVTLPAGVWSATSQVKQDVGGVLTLVEELAVTLAPIAVPDPGGPTHTILLESSSAAASDWPLGRLQCDVRFADASVPPVVLPTETFDIKVVREVTGAPA